MKKKEKIGLSLVITLSAALPFLMVRNPLEIPSLVLPLWVWYPGAVGVWFYFGKNFWQVFLACWGAGNIGTICVYFGTSLIQIAFKKMLPGKNVLKKYNILSRIDLPETRKRKWINWLNKQSLGLILFLYLIPLPWSDPIATIAMRLRNVKNGIWYLFALNVPQVLLLVFFIRAGMNLFFF